MVATKMTCSSSSFVILGLLLLPPTINGYVRSNLVVSRDVLFRLFTQSNPDEEYLLKVGDVVNLKNSSFNVRRVVKMLVHGWTTKDHDLGWMEKFRKNYLLVGDYNVILVQWYPASDVPLLEAYRRAPLVGQYMGELVNFLQRETNLNLDRVHILGHSLGAHIAGFAGHSVAGLVGRVTGMDPAAVAYEILKGPSQRLDKSDGAFVDVIHTCIGFGFVESIGHIDFYANGGFCGQPGCRRNVAKSAQCSHLIAYKFMKVSIMHPWIFPARKCNSLFQYELGSCDRNSIEFMGESVNHSVHGVYYLRTDSEYPFGRGNRTALPKIINKNNE